MLAVGGLTARKDPLTLLQAFARVRAERPDARLALVGDGPLAGAVRAGAARLGLADALTMPGALPHEAVPAWFAACDLLSVVSRVEPLGQVALEALASGRPVVATAVGGTRRGRARAGGGGRRAAGRPARRGGGDAGPAGRPARARGLPARGRGSTGWGARPSGWPRSSPTRPWRAPRPR